MKIRRTIIVKFLIVLTIILSVTFCSSPAGGGGEEIARLMASQFANACMLISKTKVD